MLHCNYLAQQLSAKIAVHNPCIYSAAIILQITYTYTQVIGKHMHNYSIHSLQIHQLKSVKQLQVPFVTE